MKFSTTHARIYVEKYKKRRFTNKQSKQKNREMEMKMCLWQYYQNEINFFERKTDKLLAETKIQETKIEKRRRQQQLHPTKKDINQLLEMITLTLKAIAIVKTYRYFQILQIPPSDQNNQLFYARREQHFKNLLANFLSKVKNENGIDFTINR